MTKKSKSILARLMKVKKRREFLDEYYEFFLFELWDEELVKTLLELPIDDEELFELCQNIEHSQEYAWNEGYDEATIAIRETLEEDGDRRPTYGNRRAVIESDYD